MLTGRRYGGRSVTSSPPISTLVFVRPLEPASTRSSVGFAATGRAQQREELARVDGQRDIVDSVVATEGLGYAIDLSTRGAAVGSCHASSSGLGPAIGLNDQP